MYLPMFSFREAHLACSYPKYADLFILRLIHEGLPMSLLEALAFGPGVSAVGGITGGTRRQTVLL